MEICCIIPTLNGGQKFSRLITSLSAQSLAFDIVVIDSGSTDDTLLAAQPVSRKIFSINREDFNHGGTRQLVIESIPGYDIYVFLTQDVFLCNSKSILNLIAPFSDPSVGAVSGCQLPHLDANCFAEHARYFNYPPISSSKSLKDACRLGIKTAFMSNSFAAYRSTALSSAGGFPLNVILGEDMFVAAKLLIAGWKVAYSAEALCRHSHNYTVREEFSRYFDIGVFHSREIWIRLALGGASSEGLKYVLSELRYLGIPRYYLWPWSILRSLSKLIGYKLGRYESKLPYRLCRLLSMHPCYWDRN